jgi:uncharacterized protein YceK
MIFLTINSTLLVATALIVGCSTTVSEKHSGQSAKVQKVLGTVRITKDGNSWILRPLDTIEEGTIIFTGKPDEDIPEATVELGKTKFVRILPESELTIERNSGGVTKLILHRGNVVCEMRRVAKGESFEIVTPHGTANLAREETRAQIFAIGVFRNFRGTMRVTTGIESEGNIQNWTLSPGQELRANEKPPGVSPIPYVIRHGVRRWD